jgi:quinol monooxygenase YgiN
MSHTHTTESTIPRLVNLVVYKVKKGHDAEFQKLLKAHWPALRKVDLVNDEPPQIWRGDNIRSQTGGTVWVELYTWKDERSADAAHQMPEVMQIWEPMTPMLEGMDIIYVERASL